MYSISMPGFILKEGGLTQRAGVLEVIYDPARLSQDFPNLDLFDRRGGGHGLSDEVFISVLVRGVGPDGQLAYAAKVITLVGEDIYNLG